MGIKTSALEDKATACHMLVVYLEELEDGFFPYLEQAGKELKQLLTFWYHEDVRSSAMAVFLQRPPATPCPLSFLQHAHAGTRCTLISAHADKTMLFIGDASHVQIGSSIRNEKQG